MHKRLMLVGVCAAVALAAIALGGSSPAVRAGGGTISGTVYFDNNMDGQRDAGDTPAPGETIQLRNEMDSDVLLTATKSGADGTYSFSSLSPSESYRVEVVVGKETFCLIAPVKTDLSGDGDWTDIDLGTVRKGEGIISGSIADDMNENGSRDPGEPSMPGWSVWLSGASGGPAASCEKVAVADTDGKFEFTGLPSYPHPYPFYAQPPEGEYSPWELTYPTRVSADPRTPGMRIPADLDGTKGNLTGVSIGVHVLKGDSSIAGGLYCDYDGDQVLDDDELSPCSLSALTEVDRKTSSIGILRLPDVPMSCRDGATVISGLPAGTYQIGIVSDWCNASPCPRLEVTLSDDQRSENNYVPLAGCERPAPSTVPTSAETPAVAGTPQPQAAIDAPNTGGGPSSTVSGRLADTLVAAFAAAGVLSLATGLRRQLRRPRRD